MGLFTLCVAAALVVIQCTTLLLQRPQTTWSFSLVSAHPDASEWEASLQALLHNGSWGGETPALICMQTLVNESSATARASYAASCLLRTHSPASIAPVLDAWNPHLILLALCCMQCLLALGQIMDLADGPHVSLVGAGCALTGVLLAAAIVQGVHAADLVRYPTVIAIALVWLNGAYYVFVSSQGESPRMAFHVRAVAAPLSVLCTAIFGTRLWSDNLLHIVLLAVAINNTRTAQGRSEFLVLVQKSITLGLPALVIALAVCGTGVYDAWRYILILTGSTGLLPLFVWGLASSERPKSLVGISLMANNAALLGVVALLANF